jgi:hypothetical protein
MRARAEGVWDFPQTISSSARLVSDVLTRHHEWLVGRCLVEAMGLEPTNLLTASQALYQLSYAPSGGSER